MLEPFEIPDDFRRFMRTVAQHLDRPGASDELDSEDAFRHECGHGGRAFGTSNYNFTYLSPDGRTRWELALRAQQIRDIADGLLIEVDGERDDIVRTTRRTNRGFPLCVWGEAREDAFRIRKAHELTDVLDLFHLIASDEPRMIRIWSAGDDQVVAIVWRDDCALYVVESVGGYGSSAGDPTRLGGFDAQDHGGSPITIAWADCIDWSVARSALIHFVEHGEVGGDVELTGSIPSGFLMLGDYDRTSIIGARGEPTPVFSETSLQRMVPTTRPTHLDLGPEDTWAERVIVGLSSLGFVDVYGPLRATVIEQLTGLLDAYGEDAIVRISTADWLANELVCMRGVMRFEATGGDLQVALHRAR